MYNKLINNKLLNKNSKLFWERIIINSSRIDFGEPLPKLDKKFIKTWSRHYAQIASLTDIKPPVLEIGTGFGVLATGLSYFSSENIISTEHKSRAYVSSPDYINHLKEKRVELVLCDLLDPLPFGNNSFNTVFFCDVIEHLPPTKISSLLNEINRILCSTGNIVLSTPNLNRLSGFFRFISGHTINPPIEVPKAGDTFGHIREFAPKELFKMIQNSKIKIQKVSYCSNEYFTSEAFGKDKVFSKFKTTLINFLTKILVRIIPQVGDEIYIFAQKINKDENCISA